MQRINEAQLELEGLKIEARSLPAFITIADIPQHLSQMEDYLRELLKEYEATKPLLDQNAPVVFSTLERLDEFTGATRRSFTCSQYHKKTDYRFITHFADLYDVVIEVISKNL